MTRTPQSGQPRTGGPCHQPNRRIAGLGRHQTAGAGTVRVRGLQHRGALFASPPLARPKPRRQQLGDQPWSKIHLRVGCVLSTSWMDLAGQARVSSRQLPIPTLDAPSPGKLISREPRNIAYVTRLHLSNPGVACTVV